jgi:hypothetical protein
LAGHGKDTFAAALAAEDPSIRIKRFADALRRFIEIILPGLPASSTVTAEQKAAQVPQETMQVCDLLRRIADATKVVLHGYQGIEHNLLIARSLCGKQDIATITTEVCVPHQPMSVGAFLQFVGTDVMRRITGPMYGSRLPCTSLAIAL